MYPGDPIDADFTPTPIRQGARGQVARPHDEAVYDLAYDVWSGLGLQNAQRTAQLLEQEHGITLPVRTLYRWQRGDRGTPWAERVFQERLADLSPTTLRETALNLAQAAQEASRWLLRATRGDVVLTRDDRVMVDAAKLALSAAGFGPRPGDAKLAHGVIAEPAEPVIDLDSLSDDELARLGTGEITSRFGHA